MTDARTLRERVAEVIAKAWDDEGRVMAGADAAIDSVLEEAARVVKALAVRHEDYNREWDEPAHGALLEAEAAIRALKSGK